MYSYLASPKDTRWSWGELARPTDETVICNFHLTAAGRGCETVNSAQRHHRRWEQPRSPGVKTSLIGIQCIIMGPGPVMLHIFMNSSSSEVWTGKTGHRWERAAIYCVGALPCFLELFWHDWGSAWCQPPLCCCCNANERDDSLICQTNSYESPLIAPAHVRTTTCTCKAFFFFLSPPLCITALHSGARWCSSAWVSLLSREVEGSINS